MSEQNYIISASLLSADFARFGDEAQEALAAGADWLHLDVMDNHYVPNLTFGAGLCSALKPLDAVLDVHLMVSPVDRLIEAFAEAGASLITFHPEASEHSMRSLQLIRSLGVRAGLSLNPATGTHWLEHCLEELDLVLLMSVNPGFSAQPFIPATLQKIARVREQIDRCGKTIHLQVDGGIKADNIARIAQAGADTFVVGSGIFSTPDRHRAVAGLRKALSQQA